MLVAVLALVAGLSAAVDTTSEGEGDPIGAQAPPVPTLGSVRCELADGDLISGRLVGLSQEAAPHVPAAEPATDSASASAGTTIVVQNQTLGRLHLAAAAVTSCTSPDSAARQLLQSISKLAIPAQPARRATKWRQTVAFSYSLARGNANLNDFSVTAGTTRTGQKTRWTTRWFRRTADRDGTRSVGLTNVAVRLNYALGSGTIDDGGGALGGPVVPYAPAATAARRSRVTVFHELGYERDGLKQLDRRVVANAGLSFLFGSQSKTRASIDFGGGLLSEQFVEAARRVIGGGLLRFDSRQPLPGGASVEERVVLLPDLAEWSRYRLNADVGVRAPLTSKVSLRLGLNNRFDTSPRPGVKKNDFAIQSGIGFDF